MRARVRAPGTKASVEADRGMSVRRALLRQSRPYRGDYAAGQAVAFWRQRTSRDGRAGWVRATIVGPGPPTGSGLSDTLWVTTGGRAVLVSKEELRDISGAEHYAPGDSEMADLEEAERQLRHREVEYDDRAADDPFEEDRPMPFFGFGAAPPDPAPAVAPQEPVPAAPHGQPDRQAACPYTPSDLPHPLTRADHCRRGRIQEKKKKTD